MSMKVKVLGGLAMAPFVAFMLVRGHYSLLGLAMFAAVVGTIEFYTLARAKDINPIMWLGVPLSAMFILLGFLGVREGVQLLLSAAVLLVLLAQLVQALQGRQAYRLADMAATIFGALYVGGLLSYVFNLRGIYLAHYKDVYPWDVVTLLPFAGAWGADTGAYFSGKFLGRIPLCPAVSPKKTLEGAVGGTAASIVCVVLFASLVGIPFLHAVLIGLLCSVAGQLGDLSESAFKRDTGVKDTGKLIVGSGGVLDRADSILFTIPVTYFYLTLFVIH